jgi:predicted RecA/RadA family phage recombinase
VNNNQGSGKTITAVAPSAMVSGTAYLIGTALFGVAGAAGGTGDLVALDTEGIFELPKLTTDDCSPGDVLYWDNTNHRLTKSSSGNTKVGVCVGLAITVTSAPTVVLKLNGTV